VSSEKLFYAGKISGEIPYEVGFVNGYCFGNLGCGEKVPSVENGYTYRKQELTLVFRKMALFSPVLDWRFSCCLRGKAANIGKFKTMFLLGTGFAIV